VLRAALGQFDGPVRSTGGQEIRRKIKFGFLLIS
jgi:hypothetical protein